MYPPKTNASVYEVDELPTAYLAEFKSFTQSKKFHHMVQLVPSQLSVLLVKGPPGSPPKISAAV